MDYCLLDEKITTKISFKQRNDFYKIQVIFQKKLLKYLMMKSSEKVLLRQVRKSILNILIRPKFPNLL